MHGRRSRSQFVKRLLDAGASGAAVNESKQTPYDMIRYASSSAVAMFLQASLMAEPVQCLINVVQSCPKLSAWLLICLAYPSIIQPACLSHALERARLCCSHSCSGSQPDRLWPCYCAVRNRATRCTATRRSRGCCGRLRARLSTA